MAKYLPKRANTRRRRIAAGGAACALVTGLIAGSAGLAQAAPMTAGKYCGTYQAGDSYLTTFTKHGTGCLDFNVVYAESLEGTYDKYSGFYQLTGGGWEEGSKGLLRINNGSCDPDTNSNCVLLTNVVTGTQMFIASDLYEDDTDNVND